jgi:hypothetical protein
MSSQVIMWNWDSDCHSTRFGCDFGRPWTEAALRIAVIGDSNAAHFLPIIAAASQGQDLSIRMLDTCSPVIDGVNIRANIPNAPTYNQFCSDKRKAIFLGIRSEPHPDVLVVASAWSSVAMILVSQYGEPLTSQAPLEAFANGLQKFVTEAKSLDVPIFLISDVPRWETDPIPCVISQQTSLLRKKCTENRDRLDWVVFNRDQKSVHDLMRTYDGKNNVSVISPEDYLCDASGCMTTINGEFFYRDAAHIRRNLRPETLRIFARLLHFEDIIAAAERRASVRRGTK